MLNEYHLDKHNRICAGTAVVMAVVRVQPFIQPLIIHDLFYFPQQMLLWHQRLQIYDDWLMPCIFPPTFHVNTPVSFMNKNSSGLERIVVAAPVTVGTPAEKMYVAVMLQRDPQSQRLYLHDAVIEKELDINSTEHLKTHRGPDTAENELYTTDILRNALNVKGKFSLKAYSDVEKKQHVTDAKAFFGRTYKWAETGYITTDGARLDFSGKHEGGPGGYRTVDHRDIRDALGDDYGGDDYSGAMVQFMGEGNIRISPESGGINLSVMPTKAQMDTLSDFISKERGEVVLDLDDTNGVTLSSTEIAEAGAFG